MREIAAQTLESHEFRSSDSVFVDDSGHSFYIEQNER